MPLLINPPRCTCCPTPLPNPLDQYGDLHTVMCADCYFNLLDEPVDEDVVLRLRPILDEVGRQIGHASHLTARGVAWWGSGKAGDMVAAHYYGKAGTA